MKDIIYPVAPAAGLKHEETRVGSINIHYVIGGKGEPLLLLHGFGQNWYMWNRLLPELGKHFTVIAPDLPGLGELDKPDIAYDKKTIAVHIHELVKALGFQSINLAGHDIGLMVAYAYAAQFGGEVKKLALMDAALPGVEPVWSQVKAFAWWFGFFSWPAAGQIVVGKEKECLTNFWPVVGHAPHPFTDEEINEFVRAYSVPGSMARTFRWFGGFEQDAIDNMIFMKERLEMPVLAMGGEFFTAPFLANHIKLVAENVTVSDITGSGHWIVQENTPQVLKGLLNFFTNFIAALIVFLFFWISPVAAQTPAIKNIVIVHGAFLDGSAWEGVYTILAKKGYHVSIVQNPLTSLADDVEATKRILDQQDGPVVLVGNSWAGTVITQAGVDPKVVALVYVAALQPDKGETSNQWLSSQPSDPSLRFTTPDKKGFIFFDRETFHAGFCADVPQTTADFMNASQQPIVGQCFATPVTAAAWKAKPSYGIVATEDKALKPDIERNMYKRANSKITEIRGSHSVFISNPEAVAQVIVNASEKN